MYSFTFQNFRDNKKEYDIIVGYIGQLWLEIHILFPLKMFIEEQQNRKKPKKHRKLFILKKINIKIGRVINYA